LYLLPRNEACFIVHDRRARHAGGPGGNWKTRDVCDSCPKRANEVADRLITKDFLVLFLRAVYEIGDRNGDVPLSPRFKVPLHEGGVVKVTLQGGAAILEGATSPAVAALLGLKGESEQDQQRLRELVGDDVRHSLTDPLQLARTIQTERTPPVLPCWACFRAPILFGGGLTPDTLVSVDLSKPAREQGNAVHNRWHPEIPPVASVNPGDVVRIECKGWTDGWINSANDVRDLPLSLVHILSGPIAVNGAQPGDLLVVDLLDIGASGTTSGAIPGSSPA
jgi:Acetamidase/Formamidase family